MSSSGMAVKAPSECRGEQSMLPAGKARGNLHQRFSRNQRGSTGVMFGMMVLPCIMTVGLSVDLGRLIMAKQEMQGYLDGATLAAGRAYQNASPSQRLTAAESAADTFWTASGANLKGTIIAPNDTNSSVTVTANASGDMITVTAVQWVATPFMSTAKLLPLSSRQISSGAPSGSVCTSSYWNCQKIVQQATAKVMAGGTSSGSKLEIAVMLDVTGSMDQKTSGSSSKKIEDLKVAAKDLIDIVLPSGQTSSSMRIALVPFSEAVYTGSEMASWATGELTPGTCSTNTPGCEYFKFNRAGSSNSTKTFKVSTKCVIARQGSDKYTDASPVTSPVDKYYPDEQGDCPIIDDNDELKNKVVPLTNDGDLLRTRITKLKTGGYTAGHIGTAWTWYMLSPNWGNPWPTDNRAAAYEPSKVKKVAILMTDGVYNHQYCKGVMSKDSDKYDSSNPAINCNGDGATSDKFAPHICDGMKDKDIVVYTIGFDMAGEPDAKAMLKACATSPAHFYDATSPTAIRTAFQDIALKVSKLVLTQ